MPGVPYTFANATTSIPLSQLDANFNTTATLGNASIGLGNVTTTVGNLTLTNVNITSGTINAAVTQSGFTGNSVIYSNTSGNLTTSANLTYDGTTFTAVNDASISGLTVGKGGGGGSSNTVVGNGALAASSADQYISAFGYLALAANTTGAYNTGIGAYTLKSMTTGTDSTALGVQALDNNTTGSFNTGLGRFALHSNTTASNNTAVGYQAGYANTTGGFNTYLGYQTGVGVTTGSYNTSLGSQAGYSLTSGTQNLFAGVGAGNAVTTGSYNTFVGRGVNGAGDVVTTGSKNTILGGYNGNQGGLDIRTASNYIVLSDGDGNPRGVFDNNGYFGVGCVSDPGNSAIPGFFVGNVSGTATRMNIGKTASGTFTAVSFYYNASQVGNIQYTNTATTYNSGSDYRLKENIAPMTGALDKLMLLKPCTYTWKLDGSAGQGFIAHELQEIIPDAVSGEKDAVDENNKPLYQGVDPRNIVATLTAAIQEQQTLITDLQARLTKAGL